MPPSGRGTAADSAHTLVADVRSVGSMFIVQRTLSIPESDNLLDLEPTTDGMGYATKVTRRREDGSVIWSALPPDSEPQDAWVAVRVEGSRVIANSWSCYLVILDLDTGEEIKRTFTK